jgi:hypothetical protein
MDNDRWFAALVISLCVLTTALLAAALFYF